MNKENEKNNLRREDKFKKNVKKYQEYCILILAFPFMVIKSVMEMVFGKSVNVTKITEAASFIAGLVLTGYCFYEIFGLIHTPPASLSGANIVAIIGAVLTPLIGLITFIFKYGKHEDVAAPKEETKKD